MAHVSPRCAAPHAVLPVRARLARGAPERIRAAQHMRVAGSGCVAPGDLEAAWPAVVADALTALVLDECARPDGRGLRDLRPLHAEARPRP